jgi:hypothetical protein
MTGDTILILVGSISGTLTSCSVLVAIPVFFYRRGKADEQIILSLKAITKANEELGTSYRKFEEKTTDTLHTHDVRLTRLEPFDYGTRGNGNGNRRR